MSKKGFPLRGFSSLPGSRVPMFGSRVYIVGERGFDRVRVNRQGGCGRVGGGSVGVA